MMNLQNLTGAVVIGRNEGVRLRRCLISLRANVDHVVYVDSGSTDNSLAIAADCGVASVSLDTSITFSAGRARNVGFDRLMSLQPNLQFVQFVDGDCELQPGWIAAALDYLSKRSDLALVCGRRRERFPERSFFNQLIDFEWETPIGECSASGGDFLIRTGCFRSAGGFNPQLIAGEEPELGFRIRQQGWKIERINYEMTWHDADLTKVSSWWKRELRGGYAGLDVQFRTGNDSLPYFAKMVRSAWFWTVGWLIVLTTMMTAGGILCGSIGILVSGLLWSLATGIQIVRIGSRYRRPQISVRSSLWLAALTILSKWPQILGQLAFLRDRILGRLPQLIEYKSASG